MKIDKIITLANKAVSLRFQAMERSLRATGCKLPLWVIPYDNEKFPLPEGAVWWENMEVFNWLSQKSSHPMMRKYQCLLESNYQYVDSDVIFLRNPEEILISVSGFITSCGHWHNPNETLTPYSRALFSKMGTTWQKNVFNAGQFACDQVLYKSLAELRIAAEGADKLKTCLAYPANDQTGLNLLVNIMGAEITNLTLPPYHMESTWAGDYSDENYSRYWANIAKKPYLIHWAGMAMWIPRPINELFFSYLTPNERNEWDTLVEFQRKCLMAKKRPWRTMARRVRNAFRVSAVSFQ